MTAIETNFETFCNNVQNKEGIVCLGCGGDLQEWINGVSNDLKKNEIVNDTPDNIWETIYKSTTLNGRTDLAFVFNKDAKFNISKMAIWRLNFGNCSWISDYIDNYRKDFV